MTRTILDIQMGSLCSKAAPGARGWPGPTSTPCTFSKLTTPAFRRKLVQIADRLGLDPSALAAVMMFETAGTMRADIQNDIQATGLIQFIPPTARLYGTTVEQLRVMTPEQQLDYVERHFRAQAPRIKTVAQHYLAVFMPDWVGMGTDLSRVVARRDAPTQFERKVYEQNKFDRSGKGYFTIGDVVGPVVSAYEAAKKRPPVVVDMTGFDLGFSLGSLLLGAAVGAGLAWAYTELGGGNMLANRRRARARRARRPSRRATPPYTALVLRGKQVIERKLGFRSQEATFQYLRRRLHQSERGQIVDARGKVVAYVNSGSLKGEIEAALARLEQKTGAKSRYVGGWEIYE